MIEFVLVLLFTASGIGAAVLARRVVPESAAVRWLAIAFTALAVANVGLYVWSAVASDPAGPARLGAAAAVLLLAVWGYLHLLRAARRAAARRGGGQ